MALPYKLYQHSPHLALGLVLPSLDQPKPGLGLGLPLTLKSEIFLERTMTDVLEFTKALSALEAEQSPIFALLMTLMALQERKKNLQI